MNFNSILFNSIVLMISFHKHVVNGWTSQELELFDLVEEINQNFYDVLGLDESASVIEVRKAYRRLSLQFHPDKNKEEGAEEKFRRIVAVSEVLRDEERRKHYDLIVQNGLPDWRQPIFYYRRVRKMGLLELFVFLSVLLTLGHFLLAWAAYWERKYELEEVLSARFKKKKQKKSKVQDDSSDDIIASQVNLIPKPSLQDLLPALLVKFIFNFFLELPTKISAWRLQKESLLDSDEETPDEDYSEERVRKKKVKTELPDYYSLALPNTITDKKEANEHTVKQYLEVEENVPRDWSEQDVIHLVKAMNKFPGGISQRWEKIASSLKRTVTEVTVKVKTLKSSTVATHVPTALQGLTGKEETLFSNTADQNFDENYNNEGDTQEGLRLRKSTQDIQADWGQPQQKALEKALQQFPKGSEFRWDRIASVVPGKNKEECLLRYKALVELVRKKKTAL